MARRGDLFARLSLDYADHPKIAGLSDGAFRAHVEMILYSRRYMTDGAIAKQIAKRWPEQVLSELLANDPATPSLGVNGDGSYQLHGFDEMQETRAEIEEKRRIRADAGRKGGLAKAKQTPSKTGSKNVPETETETETDRGRAKPARRTKLSDHFTATDAHKKKASELGINLNTELEKFKNHFIGNGDIKADWSRTFSNWLTRSAEFRPPSKEPSTSYIWD